MTAMVAAVDPTDLKSLWRLINLFQAVDPSGNSIAHKALKEACSGGADIEAIWFRATVLSLMPGMLAPWTHSGELDDAVFNIAAIFPMCQMRTSDGPPFDVQKLLEQVEQAAGD
jgi:hypothetical protein